MTEETQTTRISADYLEKVRFGRTKLKLQKYFDAVKLYPEKSAPLSDDIKSAMTISRFYLKEIAGDSNDWQMRRLLRINEILSGYLKNENKAYSEKISIAVFLHHLPPFQSFSKQTCQMFFDLEMADLIFDSPRFADCPSKISQTKIPTPWLMICCAMQIDYLNKRHHNAEDLRFIEKMKFIGSLIRALEENAKDSRVIEILKDLKEKFEIKSKVFKASVFVNVEN